ncbi:MAG TPA: sugar transferase [Puia sp.]|uniref:sugar transferase n=1 Tax=Puia sp. TaxID=2045100 RepID=UPI002C798B82|nr:sugar transferase [Puia sp.]HVU99213.1 sugar transferase [Puia sp.]
MVETKGLIYPKRNVDTHNQTVLLRSYLSEKHSYLITKRIFDILFSLCALILVFSWLFPILYILIKLDSRGPIFFVQKRVGFLGKSFPCLKFRTMYVNAEANTKQATDDDPRITRVGRFLRNSNLDEIPQFLNVLAGHMSIVGPRPHMYKDCANFSKVVDAYKLRNLMKPGITGLAQAKGYRGPAQSFDKIFRRYQWDAFYVRNANFWLDIRIIHSTAMQTFSYLLSKFIVIDEVPSAINPEWIEPKNVLN